MKSRTLTRLCHAPGLNPRHAVSGNSLTSFGLADMAPVSICFEATRQSGRRPDRRRSLRPPGGEQGTRLMQRHKRYEGLGLDKVFRRVPELALLDQRIE